MTKKEANISLFIEAALKSFVENGIYEAKVKDIAQSIGITERTAFRYFESKTDMVLESLKLLWVKYLKNVYDGYHALDLSNMTTLEKIKAVLMLYGNIYLTEKKQLLFVEEAEIYLTRNGIAMYPVQRFPKNPKVGLSPLAEVIQDAINNKDITPSSEIELLYHNSFESLLGFMQKLSVEFYNKRITDELALKKLLAFTDLLAKSFLNK